MLRTGVPHTTAWTRGRRGAVTAASAAVVVLGAVVAACGGGGPGGGYTAVGAGRGGPTAVAPTEPVTLVPLDGPAAGGASGGEAPHASGPAARTRGPAGHTSAGTPAPRGTASTHGATPGAPGRSGGQDARTTAPAVSVPPAATPSPDAPAGGPAPGPTTPAALSWGEPVTEGTDRRWCQEVTVTFHNSGGTAVRSGSVRFGTHIIGALGVDWGTVESTVPLPVPLAAGARRSPAWTVCVDAWRVPLGMRVETREVSVDWD
ncbi:hypothetical protein [Streptomyces eurythermus]|uniref:hypothetical protein n=2 Tax=Streptomyces TaxID=1883 RepID=UPI00167492D9|nr:hypothetical protein [Streptomyces eurythermus]GGR69185.1 hypothetical protein GCM10010236_24280 [Streptomyces eurythermus]